MATGCHWQHKLTSHFQWRDFVRFQIVHLLLLVGRSIGDVMMDIVLKLVLLNAMLSPIFNALCRKSYRKGYRYLALVAGHYIFCRLVDKPRGLLLFVHFVRRLPRNKNVDVEVIVVLEVIIIYRQ